MCEFSKGGGVIPVSVWKVSVRMDFQRGRVAMQNAIQSRAENDRRLLCREQDGSQPATRALRMPSVEDFPALGQKVFRARRGELPEGDHPEQRGLTLLQRLAAVALGRHEDEQEPQQTPKARPNSS